MFKGFKPYYNWNTFNTPIERIKQAVEERFKPYYNWNTFNTTTYINYI